jgi:hypothetical protein
VKDEKKMNAPWLQQDIKEIKDRLRRTETRVTKWLESQGFETGVQRPQWQNGLIEVPSSACSFKDCLAVIPDNWPHTDEIEIRVKDEFLMAVYLSPQE